MADGTDEERGWTLTVPLSRTESDDARSEYAVKQDNGFNP
jgi:hypothetical protein